MTKTLENLIDTLYRIKVFLAVSSYVLHQYEDGSFADFKVAKVNDPRTLLKIAGGHRVILLTDGENIIIRVFENV